MTREPDDARGGARGEGAGTPGLGAGTPGLGAGASGRSVAVLGAADAGRPVAGSEAPEWSELAFPKEADTLTTHEAPVLSRCDTMPAPPIEAAPPSSDALDDDDILDDELDDDTQTQVEPFEPSDEPTSPTLSLENRSDSAREVYRLFLASDYAPALALANELIAQGEDDPMLVTIARECRSSVAALSSAPPASLLHDGAPRPPPPPARSDPRSLLRPPSPPVRPQRGASLAKGMFDARMTIEEVASMTGAPVEQVLGLLERFVTMGVLPARPPR
ncbi:MAG: hypothetical protein KF764_24480 [Labilithrix sp.]|nr:hypothetical protein [Labilithrix sp.]